MRKSGYAVRLLLLSALSMAYGWGWRGDYGHELGAMLPGALVGMSVCLASGRRDWWNNVLVFGLFGAIGWAFGGSQSYGIVVGYTLHSDFGGVAYGFACLFAIGALWGAIGGGFLGLAVSRPRERLNGFIGPMLAVAAVWVAFDLNGVTAWSEKWEWLVEYDLDWLAALSAFVVAGTYAVARRSNEAKLLALLALGWWVGFVVLVLGLGWRMTPPRSDNWAGIVGMCVVLWGYLTVNSERAAIRVMAHSALYGGLGFSIGALFLSLGLTYQWSINGWRLMEQFFGLVMGLGTGLAFLKLISGDLVPQEEETSRTPLDFFGLLVLFPVVLGLNSLRGFGEWSEAAMEMPPSSRVKLLSGDMAGISPAVWFSALIVLGAAAFLGLAYRHRRNPLAIVPADALGRGQLAYLTFLWTSVACAFALKAPTLGFPGQFFSQWSFGLLALICTYLVLTIPSTERSVVDLKPSSDRYWRLGYRHWILWVAVSLVVLVLAHTATRIHPTPLQGSHHRFREHRSDAPKETQSP